MPLQPGSLIGRFRIASLLGYLAVCLLPLLMMSGNSGGGVAGGTGALSWPYPVLLPLRPLFRVFGSLEIPVADAVGAAGAYALSRVLEHSLGIAASHPLMALGVGVGSWPFFVAIVNGLIYMTGVGAVSQIP